jgi:predicted nucleotidyltransferase
MMLTERWLRPPQLEESIEGRRCIMFRLVGTLMDMQDEWLSGLRLWASQNDNIRELWLFGSRARGTSRPESDVDIAIALVPAMGFHNWAYANYVECRPQWKQQLEAIVGRSISFSEISPDTDLDIEVRSTGNLVWQR